MLSMDTSDLDEVLISNFVEHFFVLHQFWKLDVDGSSKSGTEVGWAWGDISKMLVMGECQYLFDGSSSSTKSIENFLDSSTWLHGNNSQLIFLVNPDQESLVIVMENTSSWWPVSVEVACFQESISLPIWNKKMDKCDDNIVGTYLKRKWSLMSCSEVSLLIPSSG